MKSSRRPFIILIILAILLAFLIFLVVRSTKGNRVAIDPLTSDQVGTAHLVDAGPAFVDMVSVELLESFPLQARAIVNGSLPDGCSFLGQPVISYSDLDKTFIIDLPMQKEADAMCTQALRPYSEIIPVGIDGFTAGEYTVVVNGVEANFALEIDNEVGFELDKG
jgi:inhibitor of cysteine peptidase